METMFFYFGDIWACIQKSNYIQFQFVTVVKWIVLSFLSKNMNTKGSVFLHRKRDRQHVHIQENSQPIKRCEHVCNMLKKTTPVIFQSKDL